jgi:hypothetical protein
MEQALVRVFSPNLNMKPGSTTKRKTLADRVKEMKERRNPTSRPNRDAFRQQLSAKKRSSKAQEARSKPVNHQAISAEYRERLSTRAKFKNLREVSGREVESIEEKISALKEEKRKKQQEGNEYERQ